MAPRLIRRRPLTERIRAYLDPVDFLLWLSEEMDSGNWDKWQKDWATTVGLLLNFIFILAKANAGPRRVTSDGVFGDVPESTAWLTWPTSFLVHLLSFVSFVNAAYTFLRRRHYRLFENPIDAVPSTPSAHRVRVDSSPVSSSPLRLLSSMIASESAESRSHPDSTRDVWEIAIWDPAPISLRLFCLFSPGHILLYWCFLPVAVEDLRPSISVITCVIIASLLSAQMLFLQKSFSQQSKDSSIIHKEVMNEYDTKFVHPHSHPLMRDVGTQITSDEPQSAPIEDEDVYVKTYPPAFVINRGFKTRPNPNYVKHVDAEASTSAMTPPNAPGKYLSPIPQTPSQPRDLFSPVQLQSSSRQNQLRNPSRSDGGSLGVYSHANSPLKKSASANFTGPPGQRERVQARAKRESSPVKATSYPPLPPIASDHRLAHLKDGPARRSSGRF